MALTSTRCTFIIQDDVNSLSETHQYNAGGDLAIAKTAALVLFKYRMRLCGYPAQAFALRVSNEGVFRDSQIAGSDELVGFNPAAGTYNTSAGVTQPNDSDQPKSCVLLRGESGNLHRKPIFLGAIPDIVIRENPPGPAVVQVPDWLTAFKQYRKQLISGNWGFAGRMNAVGALAPQKVVSVASDPGTGALGIAVPTAVVSYVVGQNVQLRLFKMSNSNYANPNGKWDVQSVALNTPANGLNTYYLRNTQGIGLAQIVKLGTVEGIDFQFWPYTDVILEGQTTRKRGNRFLAAPGKRLIRQKVFL